MFIIDSINIQAPPPIVWKSVIEERVDYKTRIENQIGNTYVMHQTFETPMGPTDITFLMIDQPFKKMDFILTESDEIKTLKGSWNFIPTNNGTKLQITINRLKLKMVIVPDWLLKKVFTRMMHRRLLKIKDRIEK